MKKVFLFSLLALFICGSSYAKEIKRGTYQISGSSNLNAGNIELEINNTNVSDSDVFNLEFSGNYYFADNMGFGLLFIVENEETEYFDGSFDETNLTIIGPQIIGQFPINPQTNLYLSGALGLLNIEAEDDFGTYLDVSGAAIEIGGGLAFFIVDQCSLDLGFSYLTGEGEDDISNNDLELSEFGVTGGISVYF